MCHTRASRNLSPPGWEACSPQWSRWKAAGHRDTVHNKHVHPHTWAQSRGGRPEGWGLRGGGGLPSAGPTSRTDFQHMQGTGSPAGGVLFLQGVRKPTRPESGRFLPPVLRLLRFMEKPHPRLYHSSLTGPRTPPLQGCPHTAPGAGAQPGAPPEGRAQGQALPRAWRRNRWMWGGSRVRRAPSGTGLYSFSCPRDFLDIKLALSLVGFRP